jgi:predicted ATP-grasp superfamily ATP-dependent carboligase
MHHPHANDAFAKVDTSVPIFILRRRLTGFQHGALGVARSAGRLGIGVYGVYAKRRDPAGRSRFVRGRVTLSERAPTEEWLEALLGAGRKLGRAVLVPMDDASAVFVGDHADILRESFLFPDLPNSLLRRLSNKKELHDLCRTLDIPTPEHALPTDEDELVALAADVSYPVVAKRAASWLGSFDDDAPSVFVANDAAELLSAYRRMQSPQAPNVLVQEYIPGRADAIWMFNGYFDARSDSRVAFTGQKLRQCGPDRGPTTLGICSSNQAVADMIRRLVKEVGYRGIIDVGFRYDERDGRYKLLDVNPRIGSSFRLFVGDNGLDVLRALYLDLTDQPVPATVPRVGRKWIDEPHDLVTTFQLARRDGFRELEWRRSLHGIEEAAWFARDDLRPVVSFWAATIPRVASRVLTSSDRRFDRAPIPVPMHRS